LSTKQKSGGRDCFQAKENFAAALQNALAFLGQLQKVAATVLHRVRHKVARWYFFQTKNSIFGKFWRVFQWKVLVYFMAIGLF
jgi:hypothetical protein